jgi:hypothetical protein
MIAAALIIRFLIRLPDKRGISRVSTTLDKCLPPPRFSARKHHASNQMQEPQQQ